MNTPKKTIISTIAVIAIGVEIFAITSGAPFGTSILAILGAVIGPFMALTYPFSLTFKIWYSIALLISITIFIGGILKEKHVLGHVGLVLGLLGWLACGFLGLGTGT